MGKNRKPARPSIDEPKKVVAESEKPVLEDERLLSSNEIKVVDVIEEVDGVVDGVQSHLNVRLTPEVKADNVLTILKKGTKVKILDSKKTEEGSGEKWFKIRVFNVKPEITGYAMKKYIKMI